jgi:ElaB/YqjD/DUF883 family membrane-anchored ribosome-binding protein
MSEPTDPAEIEAEIAAARERLGRTVDELSHRLDVPARARESARETASQVRDTAVGTYRENPPAVLGAGTALVGLVVALIIWRRKRSSSRRTR